MADEPREYTEDEIREHLLSHVWTMVDWWAREQRVTDIREKLAGLAFSILSTLDGCAMELPYFIVAASPHPDDKEFNRGEGENWYPESSLASGVDVSGCLHELWHKHDPRAKV